MSMEDKLKALGDKAKSAFYDLKGEVRLAKDEAERKVDTRTPLERAGDTLERAGDKAKETLDRISEKP